MRVGILYRDCTEHISTASMSVPFQELFKKHVKRIFETYFYDPLWKVHCCELTASYEMHSFNHIAETDHEETPEWFREELDSFLQDCNFCQEPIRYFHCNGIDKSESVKRIGFPKGNIGHRFEYKFGKGFEFDKSILTSKEEQKHDYLMEEVMEYARCNSIV